jgi:hypothetical protein
MDYKELELYGRKVRVYDEKHIEMEYRMVKDNWRRVKLQKSGNGYYYFSLTGEGKDHKITVHRLVFYAHNPSWDIYHNPRDNVIDHINNEPLDNRIENLRNVSHQHNHFNRPKSKGYSFHKRDKKWMATIKVSKKCIHLGCFDKEEDARNAYLTAKEKYHVIDAKLI